MPLRVMIQRGVDFTDCFRIRYLYTHNERPCHDPGEKRRDPECH
jgi:hypothetical protein